MANQPAAIPSPQQIAWHQKEIGMFIHWAPNVYQDQEYDDLSTPLDQINPSQLDTDQWVEVAQSLGAKYIVMVAKHTGGFCMWRTDTSSYGIKDTPWRGGQGDVLRDLSDSCRKKGMKLGIYLSPQDAFHGAGLAGRCDTEQAQAAYTTIYRTQLTEVLSQYGEIFEVWFDGGQEIEVADILQEYARDAVIFQSRHASIRWVGNEEGLATYPAWSAVRSDSAAASGHGTIAHSDPDGDIWMPLECDARIRSTWFWNRNNAHTVKTLDHLMELYYRSVGNGAVLLLNANPDGTGRIPQEDATRFAEFGAEIRRRFADPIGEVSGIGYSLELNDVHNQLVDHIVIQEDIAFGERVRSYEVLGYIGQDWVRLCSGTAVGNKRIEHITPVNVQKLRLHILKSAGEPHIASMSAYYTGTAAIYDPVENGMDRRKVGEWGREQFVYNSDRLTQETYALTDLIDDAGQYRLYLERLDGAQAPIQILSAQLLLGGASYPQFLHCEEHEIKLNITGLEQRIEVQVDLKAAEDLQDHGNIWLERI